MALRWGAEAKIDLLTIDGAPGGTGMSPWPMMNEWGIPTFYLQSLAYEFAEAADQARACACRTSPSAGGFSRRGRTSSRRSRWARRTSRRSAWAAR